MLHNKRYFTIKRHFTTKMTSDVKNHTSLHNSWTSEMQLDIELFDTLFTLLCRFSCHECGIPPDNEEIKGFLEGREG
jgi:hypothetical protein